MIRRPRRRAARRAAAAALAAAAIALALAACRDDEPAGPRADRTPANSLTAHDPDDPPYARRDLVRMLRERAAATPHPGDGDGRAWLESDANATAGTPGRWTIVFEAGEHGVAEGGSVFLMTSPFWGWSTPQTVEPDAPGFTSVHTDAVGVRLETATVDAQLLAVTIAGRDLVAGERIRFVFGAGPALASPDRFAERDERIWIAVDADGDGLRTVLRDSPRIDVAPRPAARLQLFLTSTAAAGERVRLTAALLDREGDAATDFQGEVLLELPDGLAGPERLVLEPRHRGVAHAELEVRAEGIHRVRGRSGELEAESNPLLADAGPAVLWADLHGHSQLSDGTGTPEDWYRYARDVAALDVAALTDHDHWGIVLLDERPELWQRILRAANEANAPGEFVSLPGYEWTSWIHGHRHVLYFADEGPLLSSLDDATDDPRELWAALGDRPALTFAHHSAGGPIPTNWAIPPDPHFEPVTEITSVHGSSEALDSPNPIYDPVPGNFVRDALDVGYRLGFVGSGDGHDGHPGLAHVASPTGGLAALIAAKHTRESVLATLRARRTYATNGPRIVLRAHLAGHAMGSTIPSGELGRNPTVHIRVSAPGELSHVDLIRSGSVVAQWNAEPRAARDAELAIPVPDLASGEYLYVRVVQVGGGAAWSSPFFID